MSRIECKCDKDCRVALWFENDAYLWASYGEKDNTETGEQQVFRFDSIDQLIEFRDMINDVIKKRVGLSND